MKIPILSYEAIVCKRNTRKSKLKNRFCLVASLAKSVVSLFLHSCIFAGTTALQDRAGCGLFEGIYIKKQPSQMFS